MVQTSETKDFLNSVFGGTEERQKIAAAWKSLPANQPLPDTPEVRDALFEMVMGMYGETLKELERN